MSDPVDRALRRAAEFQDEIAALVRRAEKAEAQLTALQQEMHGFAYEVMKRLEMLDEHTEAFTTSFKPTSCDAYIWAKRLAALLPKETP